ncbi:MAG: pobA, partial [Blastococcus sp.]|nr:pobA [Blastococcus sp.]
MRTQVGIIGAGPAGLLLSRLLALQGIDSVVLENRSREYVEARIRAGILEQHTVDTLTEAGVGDRLQREGMEHHGIYLQYPGTRHKLDFPELCGRTVWVYGQTEVTKDLIKAQLDGGPPLLFGVSDVAPEDVDTDSPRITFTDADGDRQVLECDVIAGTDGFHGVSRPLVVEGAQGRTWERTYPYAWLGILEQHTVQTLIDAGVGMRLQREGLPHDGIHLQYPGVRHHLDFPALCGRKVWVYGQTEVTKDLIKAQLDGGPPLLFDVSDVVPENVDGESPRIRFTDADGVPQVLECDAIAGTDGFHGPSRAVVTAGTAGRTWERTYPYAWLGILADVAPSADELVYS